MNDYKFYLFSEDRDGLPPYGLRAVSGKNSKETLLIVMQPSGQGGDEQVNDTLRGLFETVFRRTRRADTEVESLLQYLEEVDAGEKRPL